MYRCMFVAALLLFFLLDAAEVRASESDDYAIAASKETFTISSHFSGDTLSVFGMTDGRSQVIVELLGPRHAVDIRKVQRLYGLWIKYTSLRVDALPLYYSMVFSAKELSPHTRKVLNREKIGIDALIRTAGVTENDLEDSEMSEYIHAFIKNRLHKKVFQNPVDNLSFINDVFFRSDFHIPPSAPIGVYEVQVHLLRNGLILATRKLSVDVRHSPFNHALRVLAHQYSVFYAAIAVVMAIFFSWLLSSLLKAF